jgi:hypothetical protein
MRRLMPIMIGLFLVGAATRSQIFSEKVWSDSVQNIQVSAMHNPPERYRSVVEERKTERRTLQRISYARILYDTIHHDAVAALFSYVKMKVHMQLALPHNMLFWIIQPDEVHRIPGVPFEEEWSFPDDPWKKN